MMARFEIPNPLIFGHSFPQLRLRVDSGKQYLYSSKNYNLYIPDDKWSLTEDGTFSLSDLDSQVVLSMMGEQAPTFISDGPNDLMLPTCTGPGSERACQMLLERSEQYEDSSVESTLRLTRVNLHSSPQLYQCPMLATLLGCLDTPAEKKFAEMYYKWAIAGVHKTYDRQLGELYQYNDLSRTYAASIREWQEQQLHIDPHDWSGGSFSRSPGKLTSGIMQSIKTPALIPQVWLNYTYDPTRSPEEERRLLHDMPRRVDFVFIKERVFHVVEIDGPSHYARYEEQRHKYEVDEKLYTRNLKAERILRRQGIQIHRISNWEILNATESDLISLIPDALGMELAD